MHLWIGSKSTHVPINHLLIRLKDIQDLNNVVINDYIAPDDLDPAPSQTLPLEFQILDIDDNTQFDTFIDPIKLTLNLMLLPSKILI